MPGQHRQQRHVVGDVEEGDQVGCLEDEADAVAPQRAQVVDLPAAGPVVEDGLAAELDAARAGSITAPRHLSRVLLPEPEGPMSPTTSPGAMLISTPLSASTAVGPLP
jgi:hypothetical protein